MEDAISNLLKVDPRQHAASKSSSNTPNPSRLSVNSDENDVTHAMLLENRSFLFSTDKKKRFYILVLRVQGRPDARRHIQRILRNYPHLGPLLDSRIPENLIPVIWNDPVIQQLVSIIGHSPVFLK